MDVNSCEPVRHRPLLRGSGERASQISFRVASYRRRLGKAATTLNYSVNHAGSGSNRCSASLAPWLISISPLPAPPFSPSPTIFTLLLGLQAQPQPVANPSLTRRRRRRCAGLYALELPVLRRRKSTFIHGAENDARELVNHLPNIWLRR